MVERHESSHGRNSEGRASLADPAMLNKIDMLSACQASHYVLMPQIVVVGYQSSGKSSILARATGLPYPRETGVCTKFATQITFRRQPASCIAVSIVPGKGSSQEHADTVRAWGKQLETLDELSFIAIMKEVVTMKAIVCSHTDL